MEKVVLDTSVAVKWFVEELDSQKARGYLEEYKNGTLQIYAPEIISLELANALFFGIGYKGETLGAALDSFYSLGFSLIQLDRLILKGSAKLMEKFGIAIYDASFIYLAEKQKIPLITADTKHHKKEYSTFITYL
mgnify:CR=1 FL=1